MAEHLGDVADSVGSVGGRVTQDLHAAASAHLIVAWRDFNFGCDALESVIFGKFMQPGREVA